jgi:hypothetical protein
MRVPDQISKTVLFLGILTGEGEKYIGTGYIVTVAYGPGQVFTATQESVTTTVRVPFAFLVTARHVAEALEGQDFYIRANGRDGKVKVIQRAHDTRWWYHPTEKGSVDSALTFFPPESLYELDFEPIPITMFVGDETIKNENLGIGDEVFIAGLFTKVLGEARNIPIVRTGTVAMMPGERIPFRGELIDAYLVESRSIGGLSGSPVFIRQTISTPVTVDRFKPRWPSKRPEAGIGQRIARELRGVGRFYFLGSMIGHWQVPQGVILTESEAVNMGISPVVPAHKILEVIRQQELVQTMHRINSEAMPQGLAL